MIPLVSVITPTYNSSNHIREAVDSVRQQTIKNIEHIIIDDASEDDTVRIIQNLNKSETSINLISSTENVGPAKARNLGIEAARGRFIAFLDSDDIWFPEKLEKQISEMEHKKIPFCYSGYFWRDEDKGTSREIQVPSSLDYSKLLNSTIIATMTAIYDMQALGKVYMPDIRRRQDYALWLKILKTTPLAVGVTEPLGILRRHSNSYSSDTLKSLQYTWKVYTEIEKLPKLKALFHFLNYASRAALKRLRR